MKTVVVVDDEPIIRMDLKDMLSEMGFSVVAEGADGFDAIETCRIYKPNLLLIDIKMPIFDGISAAATIIQEKLADCVILLTAYYEENLIERAKEIGVAGYLVKPINTHTFRPAIEVAMEQNNRYHKAVKSLEKAENRIQESRVIEKAKTMIAQRDGISESDAYARMRTLSMKKQCPIGEIAKMIVDTDIEPEMIKEAKLVLMIKYHMSENGAYQKIKQLSEKKSVSMGAIARQILKSKISKDNSSEG